MGDLEREPLDENTIDSIADLICDDGGASYRQGWELPGFLRRAGWTDVPEFDDSGRKRWIVDRLHERRPDWAAMEMVIRRLADTREYQDQPRQALEVAQRLNGVLGLEGLKVTSEAGRPVVVRLAAAMVAPDTAGPIDLKKDLGTFISDQELCGILRLRLDEAATCREHGASLAAVVLLGSVLEGALLDIAMRFPSAAMSASRAPKDKRDKTLSIHEWSLARLIEVAHELGWIHADVRDFATALRSYRNLVHPNEQRRLGHTPDHDTVNICWNVVVAALNDLGSSVGG